MAATITSIDQTDTLSVIGETLRPLLTKDSGADVEIYDTRGDTDMGPPPHHHDWSETYVVLAGAVDVVIGDTAPQRLGVGSVAHAPAGTTHGYKIAADGTHFLTILSPGNGHAFFRQMDAEVSFPPDFADVARIAGTHGITLDV